MSDYDRGKYYKKKFTSQNKDGFGRSYYGRRSPTVKSESSTKIKQPTILLKARDNPEEQPSTSKQAQKETVDQAPPTEHSTPQTTKTMRKSIKFLDDSMLFTEKLQDYVHESSDFRVVAVVGPQSVGKSTLLNLLAQNRPDERLYNVSSKHFNVNQQEEYGECDLLNELKITEEEKSKFEIFKTQTTESVETNSNTTHGIDIYITPNRLILLDCQPFLSISVLDDLIQSDNKRSNLVSEFIPHENSGEIQGLQLTAFLLSICHVLILVQDYFFDSNVVRFLQTAEMLKPTHTSAEDDLNDFFPHLLLVHNKATMEDFSPKKFHVMQNIYRQIFKNSKMRGDGSLGLAASGLVYSLNESEEVEGFNLFLIPEFDNNAAPFRGHPPIEVLIRELRSNIFSAVKNPLTHIQLTEKTWLVYCSKVWENVRKSSFFVEYTKLMP